MPVGSGEGRGISPESTRAVEVIQRIVLPAPDIGVSRIPGKNRTVHVSGFRSTTFTLDKNGCPNLTPFEWQKVSGTADPKNPPKVVCRAVATMRNEEFFNPKHVPAEKDGASMISICHED